jgi:hypothetical protein
MAQEPEQADAAENIVQFTDVRRRRKSTVLGGCEFCGFRNPLYCMR